VTTTPTVLLETRALYAAWAISGGEIDSGLVVAWQVFPPEDTDREAAHLVPLVAHSNGSYGRDSFMDDPAPPRPAAHGSCFALTLEDAVAQAHELAT
jgi:hypothetical protein